MKASGINGLSSSILGYPPNPAPVHCCPGACSSLMVSPVCSGWSAEFPYEHTVPILEEEEERNTEQPHGGGSGRAQPDLRRPLWL